MRAAVVDYAIQPVTFEAEDYLWPWRRISYPNLISSYFTMLDHAAMHRKAHKLVCWGGSGAVPPPSVARTDMSLADIVMHDFESVSLDLSRTPLDEVLDFRARHGADFRAYARGVRQFGNDLLDESWTKRSDLLRERREEIADQAAELGKLSRSAFGRRAAGAFLSLAGAAWTVKQGDPISALLAAAGAAISSFPSKASAASAYTYLFTARELEHYSQTWDGSIFG
jgi:hypothetical protein